MYLSSAFGALALAYSVFAQNVTYCPSGGVCYAFNVPSTTASSGSGDIYFQITGPSSLSWIGLGQGNSMTDSNIFMIYSNAVGDNVTLSPRLGVGNIEPESDKTTIVTLLGGSGISNGVMTAKVRCSNCNTWTGGSMSLNDARSSWIYGYKTGPAIASDDISVNLAQHSKYGTTTINLQNAAGGNSSNPFETTTAASSSSNPSSSSSSSTASMSGSSTTSSDDGDSPMFTKILQAHSIIGSVAFVILFPLGAMGIRLMSSPGLVWLHAGWMAFTYLLVIASMGLGIWLAVVGHQIGEYHAIIGLVVVGCLILQPITGLAHHLIYKRSGRRNAATYPHVWWGRAIITLGIINGGLGLQLADNTKNGEIAYGVVAGVMWLIWMAVIVLAFIRSRNKHEGETGDAVFIERTNNSTERMRESSSPIRPSYFGEEVAATDQKPTEGN